MNKPKTKTKKSESRESLTTTALRALTETGNSQAQQGASLHAFRVVEGGDGMPLEPDWACRYQLPASRDLAAATWGEITRDLRERQCLSVANGDLIVRLIDFRIGYREAQKEVDEKGPMMTSKEGTRYANPAVFMMRGLDESIRQLEAELCLSPLRRGKAGKVERRIAAPRRADRFLRPANAS